MNNMNVEELMKKKFELLKLQDTATDANRAQLEADIAELDEQIKALEEGGDKM